MPLHAYICTGCGDEFEEIQKFADPPLKNCLKCKGALEKKISAPSFRLKGGGWFSDGYASKKKGADVAKQTRKKLTGKSD